MCVHNIVVFFIICINVSSFVRACIGLGYGCVLIVIIRGLHITLFFFVSQKLRELNIYVSAKHMELMTSLTALISLNLVIAPVPDPYYAADMPSLGRLVRSLTQLQSLKISTLGLHVVHTRLPPMLTSLRMDSIFCFPDPAQQQQQEPHIIQDLELTCFSSDSYVFPMPTVEYFFCCGSRPLRSLIIKPSLLDDTCQRLVANQLTQLEVAHVRMRCLCTRRVPGVYVCHLHFYTYKQLPCS